MGSSEKRSKDVVVMSDIPIFSAENLQKNLKVIQNRSLSFSITTILSLYFLILLSCFFDHVVSCLQPDLSVYYCWSPCWNNWIHWLDRFCVLLCGDAHHINCAHSQGRLLSRLVLWFMESSPFWWLPWWPYGTSIFSFSFIFTVSSCMCFFLSTSSKAQTNHRFCFLLFDSPLCSSGRILLISTSDWSYWWKW